MDSGQLVSDDLILVLVKERIEKSDCLNGYILDGYPRNIGQAKAIGELDEIDLVINLVVDIGVLVGRLTSRRTCSVCNAVYNLTARPPEIEGKCDTCGGDLYQRDDDTVETVEKRLETYRIQTEPMINYYRDLGILKDIDASQGMNNTFEALCQVLQ
jgi:adenylate kinase